MYDVNKYSLQHFIDKFEAIPENKWVIRQCSDNDDNHCAVGHCGGMNENIYFTPESCEFLSILENAVLINDGVYWEYKQATPKQRILAALYDIRYKQIQQANILEVNKLINENVLV